MSWRERKDDEEKRKRENPFDIFNNDELFNNSFFTNMMKEIEKMMGNMDDNSKITRKTFGPYVRGYSISVGPDGKPKIKQFGNMKPQIGNIQPQQEDQSKEPLIDIFADKDQVKIVAEIPGVTKENIDVTATESKVKIFAKTGSKEYETEKELSVKIKPKSASSKYNNGILELTFDRQESSDEEEFEVKIE